MSSSTIKTVKKGLPYVVVSVLTLVFWWLETMVENYAWHSQSDERELMESALNTIFLYKFFFWVLIMNLLIFSLTQFYSRNHFISLIGFGLLLALYGISYRYVDIKLSSHYYTIFQNQSVPESLLTRPLTRAGPAIGPILSHEILSKDMRSRRYAILGLMELNFHQSSDQMRVLLFDTLESVELRADVFEALSRFNTLQSNRILADFERESLDSASIEVKRLGKYFYHSR